MCQCFRYEDKKSHLTISLDKYVCSADDSVCVQGISSTFFHISRQMGDILSLSESTEVLANVT